ncbi:MAG: phosphoesterase [Desulfobacula sp.]|nr:phosphoesterase [Desulfobacula sp.]
MSAKEKLEHFLSLFNSDSRVLVIINADPDSIASSMAVKRLLWRSVKEIAIAYFNKITRPDNLAMIEYTEPGIVGLNKIKKDDHNTFVIVDSQPDHHENFLKFNYDAIIDHHPLTDDNAKFVDIRPDFGACSTMMTQYLKAKKIKPSAKLAAALMIGIKTDTSNFTRQTSLQDIRAFQYLYRFADNNIVIKVERASLSFEDLDFLGNAIKHRKIIHNRVFFHAGKITKPDELVIVADFFLTLVKVNWSIVSGIYQKQLIIIIRNDGLRKGAGNTAKEAFAMYGSAGGHKTMARAELDLKIIKKDIKKINKKAIGNWIISSIEQTAGKKIK